MAILDAETRELLDKIMATLRDGWEMLEEIHQARDARAKEGQVGSGRSA